jgi:hypothetical protein
VDPDFLQIGEEAGIVTAGVVRIGMYRCGEADRGARAECHE